MPPDVDMTYPPCFDNAKQETGFADLTLERSLIITWKPSFGCCN